MGYYDDVRKTLGLDVQKKSAGGEGLAPDYLSFRNTYWGQMQPVSYDLLWRIYMESPEVFGAVNALVDAVVGDGWELKGLKRKKNDFSDSSEDPQVSKFDEVLKRNEFVTTLRDIVSSMIIFGDAYLELVRGGANERLEFDVEDVEDEKGNIVGEKIVRAYKRTRAGLVPLKNFDYVEYERNFLKESANRRQMLKAVREYGRTADAGENTSRVERVTNGVGRVVEFFVRAAETIRIDYNEHGEVIKYIQRVKHRRVDYYPDEMVHFVMNRIGNRVYGHSSLMSLVYSIQTMFSAEGYTYDYFRRGFMPRMVYVAKNLSEEQVKRMRLSLQNVQPQQDIILFGDVDTKNVAPTNQDMQFKDLLKYLREKIFLALQVPPTLLGLTEGSNRNSAQTHMEMFDRKKKMLKRTMEEIINTQLFTKENFGMDVDFQFNEDNTREELKKAQTFKLLESSPLIHPNEVRAIYDLPALSDEELKNIGELKSKVTPFQNNIPGSVAPEKSGDKMERRELQNVDRQMENKSFLKSPHIEAEVAESRGEQGSISRHGRTYNTGEDAIVDRQHACYPFGAVPAESTNPYTERRMYAIHRGMEIERAMRAAMNPKNVFDINTDPDFGDPENPVPPKEGVAPAESRSEPEREANKDPERDEVNVKGRRVWAAPDSDDKAKA